MKVVEEPDGVKAGCLCLLCYPRHCFVCFHRVWDADEVHAPALWEDEAKLYCHVIVFSLSVVRIDVEEIYVWLLLGDMEEESVKGEN